MWKEMSAEDKQVRKGGEGDFFVTKNFKNFQKKNFFSSLAL